MELAPALLSQAVGHMLAHHDALRLRFGRGELGWQQHNADMREDVPFEHVDLSALAASEQGHALTQAAERLQASLDLSSGPLLRVALFELGAGQAQRLLLIIHHLAVDGVSWRILVEDLHTVYEQLKRGARVQLAAKTTSFKSWAEQLAAYARSAAAQDELAYWQAQPWSRSARLPVDQSNGVNSVAAARTITVSLSAPETEALLREVPSVYHTQINDVLLTALAEAFAGWTGSRSLLVDLEGHGREDLFETVDVSRTVGWFTSLFPVLLDVGNGTDPGRALKAVKEQLRAIPHRGVGYGIVRYLGGADALSLLPEPEVSFNYFGQIDHGIAETLPFRFARESSGSAHSLKNRRQHLIDVTGSVADGRLQLQWTYSTVIHDQGTITALAERFIASLRGLIAHCQASDGGYTPSDFPLVRIRQDELDRLVGLVGGPKEVADIYPVSPMQGGLLFHSLYDPSSAVYFETLSCRLVGPLDVDAFEQAWRSLVERHAVLRTAFVGQELETPLQVVLRHAELPFERHDWRAVPPPEQEERFLALQQADRARGFDFSKPPLMRLSLVRLGDQEHRLILSNHHVLFDGWSRQVLLNEIFASYDALSRHEPVRVEPVRPYRDYIAWLRRQDLGKAEAYWRGRLAGFEAPTPLGVDRPSAGPISDADRWAERNYTSPMELGRLEAFARRHKLTLNTLVQGAWALLLSRYGGSRDVVFGVTISGRPAELPEVDRMVGLFINTLPLRAAVPPEAPVAGWLQQLQAWQTELIEYQYSPLVQVQRWSEVPAGTPLFESILVFENYPSELPAAAAVTQAIRIEDVQPLERTNYPLTLIFGTGRSLLLRLIYDTRRFDAATIERLVGHFETLLAGIVASPGGRLSELPLLGEAERHRLLVEWNDTAAEYPHDKCLHELFGAQAERTPDAVAVVFEEQQLTYAELERRANQLAHHLRGLGVGPEVVVGLCIERSLEMVVGLLGILKAGGAYLPLDPSYPQERLAYMLTDARAPVLVTQAALVEQLPEHDACVVQLDADWAEIATQPTSAPASGAKPDNLAYVIYTSGSTGKPKGVHDSA